MSSINETNLETLLERQRAAFLAEGPVSYENRINRIDRCIAMIVDHQEAIISAIDKDFGSRSRHITLMTDIFTSVNGLKFVKKNLKKWMKPDKRKPNMPLGLFGAKAYVHYQPKGVVGLMTPWNVPANMIFTPLADILGAGNRVMIKPSEFTPATSELMDKLFRQYFDETEVVICNGGADVGAAFSALPFDHLIFTGATSVGKHIMRAASENMTPVTLELGGKSPVIIGNDVDIEDCAGKLTAGKILNSGQLCIAPDYCFVPDNRLEQLITLIQKNFAEFFPTIKNNADYVSMINKRHLDRINSYIIDAREQGARVIECNPASEDLSDQAANKVPLHIIINPSDDMSVMQNEIFGPIICLHSYHNIDEAISYINRRPRPLALYYFGKNKVETNKVLDSTIAGGVTVNDIGMHVGNEDIPFGGIGNSGMGAYHGIEGFKTFSHGKAVFKQGFVNLSKLAGMLPPYGDKMEKTMAAQIKK
jgi:coniferyl-aldehyde dehydrogenase